MSDYISFIYDPFNKHEGMYAFKDKWDAQISLSQYARSFGKRPYVKGSFKDGVVVIDIPPSLMIETREEIEFVLGILRALTDNEIFVTDLIVRKGDNYVYVGDFDALKDE